MNIIEKIQLQTNFSESESHLANYIFENQKLVIDMNELELATNTNTSHSTIYRLCKKMGVKGFSELKLEIAKEQNSLLSSYADIDFNKPFTKDDSFSTVVRNLGNVMKQTIDESIRLINKEDILAFVNYIENSKNIYFISSNTNLQIGYTFARKMKELGINIYVSQDYLELSLTCSTATPEDTAIVLSYSGKADFLRDCVKKLYHNKVNILLVSSIQDQRLFRYATRKILVCGNEAPLEKISTFSSHLSSQFVFDLIFAMFYQKNYDLNFERIADIYMIDK